MPLPFVVNPSSPAPIFRQIADGLRAAIGRGAIESGELLPSVRAIAEELGVNPNTVHKAVADLERDGLVTAERGRGMVVLAGTRQQARAAGEDAVLELLNDAVRQARSAGLSAERVELLLRRAQRTVGSERPGVVHERT
ncbi:MAG: GntR family transcriptional regulator [Phycisphaerae bacterium]|nr:GntR family transcriptional regulator [Phycisphaerae bacterium]